MNSDPSTWPRYWLVRGGGVGPQPVPREKASNDAEAWAYAEEVAEAHFELHRISYEKMSK